MIIGGNERLLGLLRSCEFVGFLCACNGGGVFSLLVVEVLVGF